MNLQTNPQLEMASDYVRNTNKHLFLTGKAGSGKTTFLHQFKAQRLKRMAVVAPTGVAAINAGGMTIHSLFQVPIGLHLPGVARRETAAQPRFRNEKIRLIRSLDLLVIDEISMVRADLLDAVDQVLQRIRDRPEPFGGVQLLMIGDLHQLPPVVKQEDWEMLKQYYQTPYFFGSHALQKTDYITIELKHIYRQADPEFIGLLNKVRDNRLDAAALQTLNSRYRPNYRPPADEPCITLTATNATATQINQQNLNRLPGAKQPFKATITGDFSPKSFPTEEVLEFKVGAQVMFIRNDTTTQLYFNGKLGQIARIDDDGIWVSCPGESAEIRVQPAEWQNVKYSLNEETKQIEEQVLGSFVQYPLKLAWAITIHKSQGLTFERCLIDAQAAFATGQVYVALSRCKTFDGIVLQSQIPATSIKTDPVIQEFSQDAEKNFPTTTQLLAAKREYQVNTLQFLFDFGEIARASKKLVLLSQDHSQTVLPETQEQFRALEARVSAELSQVSDKFAPQLTQYLQADSLPEANEALQARLAKASTYFTEKLQSHLHETNQLSLTTDNKEVTKVMNKVVEALQLSLTVKQAAFSACQSGFSAENVQRAKVNAELDFRSHARGEASAGGVRSTRVPKHMPNPDLYRILLEWRTQIAQRNNLSDYEVVPNSTLRDIVTYLPEDKASLHKMPGIGKARLQRYGQEMLEIVGKYRKDHPNDPPPTRMDSDRLAGVSETKRLSFELWKTCQDISQVAARRGLTTSTITGHLAIFVERGDLDVFSLNQREKVEEILPYLQANPEASSPIVKAHFGDKYDYQELKLIMAHWRFLQMRESLQNEAASPTLPETQG